MARRPFRIFSAFSLLLFLLTATLFLRGFFVDDHLTLTRWNPTATQGHDLLIHSDAKFLHVRLHHITNPPNSTARPQPRPPGLHLTHTSQPAHAHPGLWSWLWYDHYHDYPTPADYHECYILQLRPWLLPLATAIFPTFFFVRLRRTRRRARAGLCPTCHYDLRATPTQCPECGHRPTTTTSSPPVPETRPTPHPQIRVD